MKTIFPETEKHFAFERIQISFRENLHENLCDKVFTEGLTDD